LVDILRVVARIREVWVGLVFRVSRQSALQRFQLLRAHLEDGRSLAAVAREAKILLSKGCSIGWSYRTSGLAALA
jgi:hypothetical protein